MGLDFQFSAIIELRFGSQASLKPNFYKMQIGFVNIIRRIRVRRPQRALATKKTCYVNPEKWDAINQIASQSGDVAATNSSQVF